MRIVALVVALVVAGSPLMPPRSAGACATHNEYKRIHEGMWRHRVILVLGVVGDPGIHHDGITTRRYEGCESGTAAYIDFRDRRVVKKTWVGQEGVYVNRTTVPLGECSDMSFARQLARRTIAEPVNTSRVA